MLFRSQSTYTQSTFRSTWDPFRVDFRCGKARQFEICVFVCVTTKFLASCHPQSALDLALSESCAATTINIIPLETEWIHEKIHISDVFY